MAAMCRQTAGWFVIPVFPHELSAARVPGQEPHGLGLPLGRAAKLALDHSWSIQSAAVPLGEATCETEISGEPSPACPDLDVEEYEALDPAMIAVRHGARPTRAGSNFV